MLQQYLQYCLADLVLLPAAVLAQAPDRVRQVQAAGGQLRAALPRVCWDEERPALAKQLETLAALGVTHARVPTWDLVPVARDLGFALWGDFGLGVYNSRTLEGLAELGFAGATASFELKWPLLRDLIKPLPTEAIVYGRLPLMLLEQAPGGAETEALTDRLGVTFPLRRTDSGRYELLNSQVLYLADKPEWKRAGLSCARLSFTDESPQRCLAVAREYAEGGLPPRDFTRGLYYRDVE